eukprot:SAG31_NODE_2800_length_5077_cov_2.098433_13_plen_85_part_01
MAVAPHPRSSLLRWHCPSAAANTQVAGGSDGTTAVKPLSTGGEDGKWAWIDFDMTDPSTETLVLRVATSLISSSQAQLNVRLRQR